MIKISRLRLKNFKSFKKAELPFANGFTAIVGSNGSGKSNLFDALLFVLGITSMKALRAGKMVDLINHNSDTDYANVEVELKDGQKKFELSRSIDKQGRAIVRLDGKRVGLNEAQSLLEELGINATGHNIVVQGDVTRIIEMNEIQRREIIDDMAGLREFDEKKGEALKELEKVDTKIKEVRIVLAERDAYLAELNRERQSAMEFNALNDELKKSKATLLKDEIEKIESGLKENKDKNQKFGLEKTEKEKRLSEAKEELEALEKEIEALNQKILLSKEKTFSGVGIELEEKKAAKKVREERQNSKQEAIEKNRKRIGLLNARNSELEKEQVEKKKKLEEKEIELKQVEKELSVLKEQYSAVSEKLKSQGSELKGMESEADSLNEELNNAKEEYFEKKSRLQSKKDSLESNKKALHELEKENAELSEKFSELQKKSDSLKSLKAKHAEPGKELKRAEKALEDANAKISYGESRLDALAESIEKLSKAAANCPTCDCRLSAEKKRGILEKKQGELRQINAEKEKLLEILKERRGQKRELESAIAEISGLSIELKGFEELKKKKSLAEERLSETKKAISRIGTAALEKEIEASEKRIAGLEQKLGEKEGELDAAKKKADFSVVQALTEKSNQAMQRRNQLSEQRKELELDATKIIFEERSNNLKQIESIKKENSELDSLIEAGKSEIASLDEKLKSLEIELLKAEKASKAIIEERERKSLKNAELKEKINKADSALRELERRENQLNIENSKLEVRLGDLQQEFAEFAEISAIKEFDAAQLRKRIPEIERRIKELGAINLKAIENFGSQEQEMLEIKRKSDKLEQERLAVLEMINKIEVRRTEVFMDCFNSVSGNFNKIFFELADGQGKLMLTDMQMPLESGLLIEASFRGKENKNIDLMSGGEKTLTALAFLFALQLYEPAPFYLFDEADAALDKENSIKFSRILNNIAKTSQFIAITHNDTVIREADQIVGVALNKDKSSVIGLKLKEELEASTSNGNGNGQVVHTVN